MNEKAIIIATNHGNLLSSMKVEYVFQDDLSKLEKI